MEYRKTIFDHLIVATLIIVTSFGLFLSFVEIFNFFDLYTSFGNSSFFSFNKKIDRIFGLSTIIVSLFLIKKLVPNQITRISKVYLKKGERSSDNTSAKFPVIILIGVILTLFSLSTAFDFLNNPVMDLDPFHSGEISVQTPLIPAEVYRSVSPIKSAVPGYVFHYFKMENTLENIFLIYYIIYLLGFLGLYGLYVNSHLLFRDRISLTPSLIFIILVSMGFFDISLYRSGFFIIFLNGIVAHLVYRSRMILILCPIFLSLQLIHSIEFGIMGIVVFSFYLISGYLNKRMTFSDIVSPSLSLILSLLLLIRFRLIGFIGFIMYTLNISNTNGLPCPFCPTTIYAPVDIYSISFFGFWLVLLFVLCIMSPNLARVKISRKETLLSILFIVMFMSLFVAFGRSDYWHFRVSLLFSIHFSILAGMYSKFRYLSIVCIIIILPFTLFSLPSNFPYYSPPISIQNNASVSMSRLHATIPTFQYEKIEKIDNLINLTNSKSMYILSDEPLYNYLLEYDYGLEYPLIFDILTEEALLSESRRFRDWMPDLVIWDSNQNRDIDGVSNLMRASVLSGTIFQNYKPILKCDTYIYFIKKWGKPTSDVVEGCTDISIDDLSTVYPLYDQPHNIGLKMNSIINYTYLDIELTHDTPCTAYTNDKKIFYFNGKKGNNSYAFYPLSSPVYHQSNNNQFSIKCD